MLKVRGSVAIWGLMAVAVVAVTGAGWARVTSRANDARVLPSVGHASPVHSEPASRARVVRVFVHGDDIYPDVVRTRPGKVLLRAENETQSDVSLIVERLVPGQAAQAIATIRVERRGKRADGELTLGEGEFVFYEQSRPEVRGRLIVEAR